MNSKTLLLTAALCGSLTPSIWADDEKEETREEKSAREKEDEWRAPYDGKFHVFLSPAFMSGIDRLVDRVEENHNLDLENETPLGLALGVTYELPCGFGMGLTVGPGWSSWVDDDHDHDDDDDDDHDHDDDDYVWMLPLTLDARYYFCPGKDISPYARVGVTYNLAGGDFIDSGRAGVLAAVGVEFMRTKMFGFGLEAAYNSSEIDVKSRTNDDTGEFFRERHVRTHEFTLSLFVRF